MTVDVFGNRLLLVDDDPAFGRLMKRLAEGSGFEVEVTDDPVVFVRTARAWHPSVIVLDLKIPGMDGIELLRALAADKCAAHVVLASGSDVKILESAHQLGRERGLNMSGMLRKPAHVDTVRELLATFKPVAKHLLSADLAEAIAANDLFLEYQPKFDPRRRRVIGAEALVRWRHRTHGIIRPDQFITIAEETTLIHRLTEWVVANAAKQAHLWQRAGYKIELAVNISAKDLEDLDLPERLDQCCRDAGVDPETMLLELTETGTMREPTLMMDVLTRLRLKGFKLSIDDFGTGYSSLVQLQRMPFSELKIDQSFVKEMTTNNGCSIIAEIVVTLAHKLGLQSVAEGVETAATLDSLIAMGCDIAQGYYLGRPMAADALTAVMHEETAKSA
jgi:EAL domain-containing protein (putative c-di-GMP-specific phosphodiesterase class I)